MEVKNTNGCVICKMFTSIDVMSRTYTGIVIEMNAKKNSKTCIKIL